MSAFKRFFAAALLVMILYYAPGLGENSGGFVDPDQEYRQIVYSIEDKKYQQAIEHYQLYKDYFGDYPEALLYYYYAGGMLSLEEATTEALENAVKSFELILMMPGQSEFPDNELLVPAASLVQYAKGRICENEMETLMKQKNDAWEAKRDEAVEFYKACGVHLDTIERIERLIGINPIRPIKGIKTEKTAVSVTVTWEDSESTESYEITCKPESGGEAIEAVVEACAFTADGLIPDTAYTVSILPQGAVNAVKVSFVTDTVPALNEGQDVLKAMSSREGKARLKTYTDRDAQRYTDLSQLYRRMSDVVPEEGVVYVRVDKGYAVGQNHYSLAVTLQNSDPGKTTMTWMGVLRLESKGVYAWSQELNAPALSKDGKPMDNTFIFDLTELLTACYNGQEQTWPEGRATIELYIDGYFVDKMDVELKLN